METIRIAVVSPDEDYNRVFCLSLVDACQQLEVTAYTTREFVLQWADHEGPGAFYDQYDLILWAGDEIRESYGDNIVYVTDRSSLVDTDYERNRFALYKYSRADSIVAAVFDIYEHLTGRQALRMKTDVKLFAFASYCGGAGCTTVMRAVSQELSRFHGKRVLCLSLEDIDAASEFLPLQEGVRSESEFLYRLLGRGTMPFLEPYLVRDMFGVYSFAPPAGKNPLRDLSGIEMQQLLAALMESGAFDVMSADLSTSLGAAAMTVLESADRICLIAKTAEPGMRERYYRKQLADECSRKITNKIIRTVRLPDPDTGTEQSLSLQAPLEGKFGREISKLTERLLDVVE